MRRDIISTPFDATDEQKKAYELWTSFEKEVIFRTRYYVTHPLLEQLRVYLSKNNLRINAGEVFYRARIITDTAQKDYMMKICAEKDGNYKRFLSKSNKFKGLTKEASFVPTDNLIIKDGRANPRYIKYLYMAENPTTAIFEVRPLITDRINVSEIVVNEELKIADLTFDYFSIIPEKRDEMQWLLFYIHRAFSIPTIDPDEYLPSQIIAENIKQWGYDGIRYNSSLHSGGVNITVFNYEKCDAISSRDMIINQIKLTARTAGDLTIDETMLFIKDNESILVDINDIRSKTVIPRHKRY